MKKPKEFKSCRECHKEFSSSTRSQIYCSEKCAMAKYSSNVLKVDGVKLVGSKVGTIAELVVCADLIKRGYDVFRAVSPSSGADLVAIKNENKVFVEVRTAQVSQSGKLSYPTNLNCDYVNYFACVIHKSNTITYIPLGDEVFDDLH